MNITRFASHARTWLLIAGLTALLVGIGALIGGTFLSTSSPLSRSRST